MVVASIVAVGGLWYTAIQTQQANEQSRQSNQQAWEERKLSKEGQITDRYTAAVRNLGDEKADVRLGGVYALERIMQDSPRDHPSIANVLNTFARTHAGERGKKSQDSDKVPVDVQAALTVLVTRDVSHDKNFTPNLKSAQLRNADLTDPEDSDWDARSEGQLRINDGVAQLKNADLSGADLRGATLDRADLGIADLHDANLRGAELFQADLSRADLTNANLSNANLYEAKLDLVNLTGADLSGADLRRVSLDRADLRGVNLRGAGLDGVDLRGALVAGEDLEYAARHGART